MTALCYCWYSRHVVTVFSSGSSSSAPGSNLSCIAPRSPDDRNDSNHCFVPALLAVQPSCGDNDSSSNSSSTPDSIVSILTLTCIKQQQLHVHSVLSSEQPQAFDNSTTVVVAAAAAAAAAGVNLPVGSNSSGRTCPNRMMLF